MLEGSNTWVAADGDREDITGAILGLNPSGPDGVVGVVEVDLGDATRFRCFIREEDGPEPADRCVLWRGEGQAFWTFIQARLPSRISVLGFDPFCPGRVWVVTRQSDKAAWDEAQTRPGWAQSGPNHELGWLER